jgi:hypothetical protein
MPLGAVGWAVVGSAAIGAIGSNMAADTQASAQRDAANQQWRMFDTIQGQEKPYMDAGSAATGRLADLLGTSGNTKAAGYGSLTKPFTPADYLANKDPGYDFQLKTGGQALRNADTPGIGSLSGAALKDLVGFNQGMASTGYQNAFTRYNTTMGNTYNRLSGLATLGQNAASNTGAQGTTLAGNAGSATAAAGASTAAGTLGATGSLAGGANTLAGMMYLNGNNSGGINSSASGAFSANGGTTAGQFDNTDLNAIYSVGGT